MSSAGAVEANRLEDPALVRELYEASMAGVEIDLIVRDICRLRPNLEGVSETIDVHSIVGRFLEHSRIYYFHAGGEERYYVGSADWMERNFDNRVEAVAPIRDTKLQSQLETIIETLLADTENRWCMAADGSYHRATTSADGSSVDVHEAFMERARDGESY
ncbi:polyphosphate kinase [Halobiforma lacisalsi AJ5]|uniref:Polyphosphate kinase n=1 Tax=Natronobacterium lacisalsi AJ5 TaxID=358396 RepID=M0LER3_NATLA|nr:polyphosphate kinase [Halobiforma lacisalsi AJ5]EMA31588.1 polyphosphate kinase [Halobiforma lacisalsi AJ5]